MVQGGLWQQGCFFTTTKKFSRLYFAPLTIRTVLAGGPMIGVRSLSLGIHACASLAPGFFWGDLVNARECFCMLSQPAMLADVEGITAPCFNDYVVETLRP